MDRLDHIDGKMEEVLKLVGKKNPDKSIIKACMKEVRRNVGFRMYSLNMIQTTEKGKINVGGSVRLTVFQFSALVEHDILFYLLYLTSLNKLLSHNNCNYFYYFYFYIISLFLFLCHQFLNTIGNNDIY